MSQWARSVAQVYRNLETLVDQCFVPVMDQILVVLEDLLATSRW
jgi:hypothetical protein